MSGIFESIGSLLNSLLQIPISLFQALLNVLNLIAVTITSFLTTLFHGFENVFSAAFKTLESVFSSAIGLITDTVNAGIKLTGGAIHFVLGNFVALAFVAGGIYWYNNVYAPKNRKQRIGTTSSQKQAF
ncbi:hypothetical protein BT69DRAFT_1282824 [Atractiella rhizophila]|nr:hypothetical protein BT69DRAFT_1285241 [Atractiella rhizophila]KAH8921902.1 hypothetical protein BT69DRAFT_1282824 [Atractiella rhizophila]